MSKFSPGDKVHWTHVKWGRRTATATTMHGTVVGTERNNPELYVCKYRNGRVVVVHKNRLRPADQTTELTEAMTHSKESKK